MIDRDHKLPLARQAKAVGISRGSIYYRPRSVGEAGLGLMRRIDELHLEYPFAGSRMMRGLLRQEGLSSGRRHIATLMRRMGIEALYRKPNTSRRRPGDTVYPYLLRGLEVSRPNQVWAMDSSGPHHQDSGEAKIRESTAGVSRKPSSDGKACGCSSKHLCGLTAWNT